MASATDSTVTVEFNPTAINLQADIIFGATATKAGVMTAADKAKLDGLIPSTVGVGVAVYSPSGVGAPVRPDPSTIGATAALAIMIWNIDDRQPNWSGSIDGGVTFNWYDADGNLT